LNGYPVSAENENSEEDSFWIQRLHL
jgi:hypothetical protein